MDVAGLEIIVGAFILASTVIATVLTAATLLSYVVLREEDHGEAPMAPAVGPTRQAA